MIINKEVTVLIKSCLRLDSVYRLYKSVRKNHPHVPIVVVHDLCEEEVVTFPEDEALTLLTFCEDLGLSGGRNIGLGAISTPYFILMDDDFVVPPSFSLEKAVSQISERSSDIMSFSFYDLVFFERRYRGVYEEDINTKALVVNNTICNDRLDFVLNCFIAKTEAIKNILWDEKIKLGYEHDDFFIRAKLKSIVISHSSDQKIWHLPTFNDSYNSRRNDVSKYYEIFKSKHNITSVKHVGNARYSKLGGKIYYKLAGPLYKRFSPIFLKLVDFYLK